MHRRTDQLAHGDRVRLPGRLVRTVDHVRPLGYDNYRGDPILGVYYLEGKTPEWSEGNSAIPETLWDVEPVEP